MSGHANIPTVTPEIRDWGNGFMLAALAVGAVGVATWFLLGGGSRGSGNVRDDASDPDAVELSRASQQIAVRIDTFCGNLKNVRDDLTTARASMESLRSGLGSNPKLQPPKPPASQPTDGGRKAKGELDDSRQQSLADFLAEQNKLLAMANGLGNEFDGVSKRLDALKPAETLTTFSAEIKAVESTTQHPAPIKGLADLVATMQEARKIAEDAGTVISGQAVTEEYVRRKVEFKSALDKVSEAWIQGFQQRDQDPETKKILEETFDRSREKFERASKLFNRAKERDEAVMGTPTPFVPATPLPTFDMSGAFGADLAARLVSPQVSDIDIETAATVATKHVADVFASQDPESDIIFDLLLKNSNDFENDIAKVLPERPSNEVLELIAVAMEAKMRELNPHKMPSDRSSVTVGGKSYKKPGGAAPIGGGSFGEVNRYFSDDGKESVAVKHIYDIYGPEYQHNEMVKDLRMHRQAMGSNGHPNMVHLHGAWLDEKGNLYSVQEDCAGGNVEQFANGMQAAAECGVMSERGRNALVLDTFRGAAQGMKHVVNSGMNHGDLKTLNVFVSADGTAKIGDFGTAGIADEKGVGGDVGSAQFGPLGADGNAEMVSSQRRDVFMLGAMLDRLGGGIGIVDGGYQGPAAEQYGKHSRVTGHQETALDRLRNAMLDPDASQRPTIDAVMLASYLNEDPDGEEKDQPALEPAELVALKKAVIAYTKEVGDKVADPLARIAQAKDKIKQSLAQFIKAEENDKPTKRAEYVKLLGEQQKEIDKQRERLNEINSGTNVATLVKEIKEASAAFGEATNRAQR